MSASIASRDVASPASRGAQGTPQSDAASATLAEAMAAAAEEDLREPASPPPALQAARQLGVLPPAPFFPKGPRSKARGLLSSALGESGTASELLKGADLRMRRLEQETSDLREAYARKIATTELKCESLLRDKDKEMSDWYKDKRHEIGKMKASLVIMRALFEKAREKFKTEAEKAREACEVEQERILAEAAEAKREHEEEIERMTAEMEAKEQAHRQRLGEVERQRDDLQRHKDNLESQLAASQRNERGLRETNEVLRKEGEELRKRVTELEASDEMQRKNAAIEALEQELKRSKKHMQEKNRAEIESLRKELMDYVRFIVNILPDNMQPPQVAACGVGDELQSAREFRQRMLARHQQQTGGCRSPKDASHGTLPPVGPNAGGYGGGRFGAPVSARGGRF